MAIILLFLLGCAVYGFYVRPTGAASFLLAGGVLALTSAVWLTGKV